jgi:hypothetical protein
MVLCLLVLLFTPDDGSNKFFQNPTLNNITSHKIVLLIHNTASKYLVKEKVEKLHLMHIEVRGGD